MWKSGVVGGRCGKHGCSYKLREATVGSYRSVNYCQLEKIVKS